ncbi:MAG: hypothetical protein K9N49_05410 [Candidatus Marinimicrobia bacterium]|nr:hypothetical protein [Candidatus Neomarinimicrobiota bacterium]
MQEDGTELVNVVVDLPRELSDRLHDIAEKVKVQLDELIALAIEHQLPRFEAQVAAQPEAAVAPEGLDAV